MSDSLFESSTKILYSIKNLSGEVKLYWSKYLTFSFPSFTQAQKRQKEIILATKPALPKDKVESEFNSLSDDDKIWVLSSLRLLSEYAANAGDWISNREVTLLQQRLGASNWHIAVTEKYATISRNFNDYENRKVFLIPGSISIIVWDYLLRWALLIICNHFNVSSGAIVILNFLLIPAFILLIAAWRSRSDRVHNKSLVAKTGFTKLFRVRFRYTDLQYSVIGFCLITGLLTAFLLIDDLLGGMGVMVALLLYYLFLFNVLPIGRLSEYGLLQQTHSREDLNILDADGNDEAIVSIETQLNSSTGRLEAYVLESALFGALAFSGFLQIIATDMISFPDLEKFSSYCFHISQSLINANWAAFDKYASLLNNKVSLFCMVSIETLICSVFFLAVIASRLRFSDVADKVRASLNLAKAYNEKEEQTVLIEPNEKSLSRLRLLNEKIYTHIKESRLYLNSITPIVAYMVYFRNAGLFTFLAVLVTSSLFVSSFMGWSFIAIGVFTFIYFNLKLIRSLLSSFGFYFQIFFSKYSRMLLVMAMLPALLGFFLSVGLHWLHTDFLIALGYFLGGVYIGIWFVLMPHPDDQFGDIENSNNEAWRSSGWRLIKNVYGFLILVCFAGFGCKVLSLNGSNEMLLIGFSGLSLGSYLVGFYLTRPRWLGFLVAVMFGTACMGTVFRILHYAGAIEMNILASALTPFFIGLYFFKRKSFHFILLRIALIFFVLIFLFSPFIDKPLWRRIQIMYEHRTIHTQKIFELRNRIYLEFELPEKIDPIMFDHSVSACNEYIGVYGNKFGRTEIYKQVRGVYYEIAERILSNTAKQDTSSLLIAWKSALQMKKIDSLFDGEFLNWDEIRLETDALMALGKIADAKLFLQEVIAKSDDEEVAKEAKNKLKELSSNPHE